MTKLRNPILIAITQRKREQKNRNYSESTLVPLILKNRGATKEMRGVEVGRSKGLDQHVGFLSGEGVKACGFKCPARTPYPSLIDPK